MNISLTGHHLEITPALREHVHSRLVRLTPHFDHMIEIKVTLSVEKLLHRAEATIHVPGHDIHADDTGENMYVVIDQLADKLDRQLIKHKEKRADHHRAEGGLKHHTSE